MNIADVIIIVELLFLWMAIPTSSSNQLWEIRQELHKLNRKVDTLIEIMRSEKNEA